MTGRDCYLFAPDDQPAIEVEIGENRYCGRLRAWVRRSDMWWASIRYQVGETEHAATVPAARIHPIDRRAHAPKIVPQASPSHRGDGDAAR